MRETKDVTLELGRCPLKRSTIKKVAKDVLDINYACTKWTLTKTLFNLWEIQILNCGPKADFSNAEFRIKIELARLTRLYWDLKLLHECKCKNSVEFQNHYPHHEKGCDCEYRGKGKNE